MAPSEAAAMPFPNEETTPPVTNTNLVMREPAEWLNRRRKMRVSTGRQVNKSARASKPLREFAYKISARSRPQEPRASPGFDSGGNRRVDPAIGDRDQAIPGEQQWQTRAFAHRNFRALQYRLQSLCARRFGQAQAFSAGPRAKLERARQEREVDRTGFVIHQFER